MHKLLRKVLRVVADRDPDYYDMYADSDEQLFARLYLERIAQHALAAGIRPPAMVLDAGCQAGRLAVPLAQQGFRVTGVDTSRYALRRAREHAEAARVPLTLVQGDIGQLLARGTLAEYDMVIFAEVLYLVREYRTLLQRLVQAVRPGGLLCVSHRPQAYYLVEALRQQDRATAAQILIRGEGPFRDAAYYNWQTPEELQTLYGALGLQWQAMYPIDRLAWLAGFRPSELPAGAREAWLHLELDIEPEDVAYGRYVLVVSAKPTPATQEVSR